MTAHAIALARPDATTRRRVAGLGLTLITCTPGIALVTVPGPPDWRMHAARHRLSTCARLHGDGVDLLPLPARRPLLLDAARSAVLASAEQLEEDLHRIAPRPEIHLVISPNVPAPHREPGTDVARWPGSDPAPDRGPRPRHPEPADAPTQRHARDNPHVACADTPGAERAAGRTWLRARADTYWSGEALCAAREAWLSRLADTLAAQVAPVVAHIAPRPAGAGAIALGALLLPDRDMPGGLSHQLARAIGALPPPPDLGGDGIAHGALRAIGPWPPMSFCRPLATGPSAAERDA
ncbi:MAG: hypothetical protein AAFU80_10365 [Pseudomonadota bacterium]